jgi:hypothetical protein
MVDNSRMIRVRIKASGQVLEMAPHPARAMILGGTAEEVKSESMAVAPAVECAVAPAQAEPAKKSLLSRRKVG